MRKIRAKKKLSSESKLVAFTVTTVAVVFGIVMCLLYYGARRQALQTALQNEQTDLNRNVELLQVMLRNGTAPHEVRRVATAPWNDGSGDYIVTDVSVAPDVPDGSWLISAVVNAGEESFQVNETFTDSQLLQQVKTPLRYLIGIGILAVLSLIFAVRFAILRVSRPEIIRRQRLNAELSVAERIQRGLLPSVSDGVPPELDVAATLRPAKEIAGDFYNFLTVNGHFHFIIADVSGKGIPAALFMAVTSKLYATAASADLSPAAIAERLNAELLRDNSEAMFATAIIGRLNLATGHLELCNAGHNPPIAVSPCANPRFVKLPQNLPLGVIADMEFDSVTMTLYTDEHLLLYTDGITESTDAQGVQLGDAALLQVMHMCSGESASQILQTVIHAADKHCDRAEQADDITVMDLRMLAATLAIPADREGLRELYSFAESHAMPDRLQLIADEAVANVISYSKATTIRIEYSRAKEARRLVITDDGVPFDPTKADMPDTGVGAAVGGEEASDDGCPQELKIGGNGINLMRALSKSLEYQREDNNNILTVTQTDQNEIRHRTNT